MRPKLEYLDKRTNKSYRHHQVHNDENGNRLGNKQCGVKTAGRKGLKNDKQGTINKCQEEPRRVGEMKLRKRRSPKNEYFGRMERVKQDDKVFVQQWTE
jgi:hypothetical protein